MVPGPLGINDDKGAAFAELKTLDGRAVNPAPLPLQRLRPLAQCFQSGFIFRFRGATSPDTDEDMPLVAPLCPGADPPLRRFFAQLLDVRHDLLYHSRRRRTMIKSERKSMSNNETDPIVGIIMGSKSDWETMAHAHETLSRFDVAHECRIVSAHRTPDLLADYAKGAEERGLEVLIAGAGGAAHLPGMAAAFTLIPVLGVPVESHALKGQDSLLSIVQMPGGVPVGTLAIGKAGAINAALLAVAILSNSRPALREKLRRFREEQTARVLADELPL